MNLALGSLGLAGDLTYVHDAWRAEFADRLARLKPAKFPLIEPYLDVFKDHVELMGFLSPETGGRHHFPRIVLGDNSEFVLPNTVPISAQDRHDLGHDLQTRVENFLSVCLF